MIPQPLILLILDGWGQAAAGPGNAIALARTPNLTQLQNAYPHTSLQAAGEAVGLPPHEDGNTETGHLNLGAGHIVYQDLPRINLSIADGSFFNNPAFATAVTHVKSRSSRLHLLGLVGSGGVHSHLDHLSALIRLAHQTQLSKVYLHLITDGRDSPPTAASNLVSQVLKLCHSLNLGVIATIMGRYFAMDRDQRWDRTQKAYQALTDGSPVTAPDALTAINQAYGQNQTDEFILPTTITDSNHQPLGLIQDHDAVIFFNFRIDRPRQLTRAFVLPNFETDFAPISTFDPYAVKYFKKHQPETLPSQPFQRHRILTDLLFVTLTQYERDLPVTVAFPPQPVEYPLGAVLAGHDKHQLRLTETEKERFVTYYFNGLREDPFQGEDRVIIPSPQVATYDLKPEMSAYELTQTLIERLSNISYDLVVVNFPNPDMVAHTGNLTATITACQVVDDCVGKIAAAVLPRGGGVLVTADHGNAEELIDPSTGSVDTEHSTNPVPFIWVSQNSATPRQLAPGILADVAPTILKLLQIPQPTQMTGRPLL